MRVKKTNKQLTVKAVAGTRVVLLAWDFPKEKCDGLLGFAIHRSDKENQEGFWMQGMKVFPSVTVDVPPGGKVSTLKHPIQGFTWSDFSADPDHEYTYRVVAMTGTPAAPKQSVATEVTISTEPEELDNGHETYFNRGTAASQEYANRFQNKSPDVVGDAAFAWLSRGLHEAMIRFIEKAKDKDWGLRVAAYEFTEDSILQALKSAHQRTNDVQVLYHAREGVDFDSKGKQTQTGANRRAVTDNGIRGFCFERLAAPTSAISHNKFIVLLHKDKPVKVLTGSTNFSKGGIFGHSNVVQVVDDTDIAGKYLDYWNELMGDPVKKDVAPALAKLCPLPPPPLKSNQPPKGTCTVFSPRSTAEALDFYGAMAGRAKDALFMTFAFGMHPTFQNVYATSKAPLRFTIMEKMAMPGKNKARDEAAIITLRKMVENRMAIGGVKPFHVLEHWASEKLTGFNVNVKFLHTKYMIVDPLGDDPIVVTGSANFSKASSDTNDENMLVIRGDTRVADIYLGEFMRLYKHFAFRDWLNHEVEEKKIDPKTLKKNLPLPVEHLDETNIWWKEWFGGSGKSREREYFSA